MLYSLCSPLNMHSSTLGKLLMKHNILCQLCIFGACCSKEFQTLPSGLCFNSQTFCHCPLAC